MDDFIFKICKSNISKIPTVMNVKFKDSHFDIIIYNHYGNIKIFLNKCPHYNFMLSLSLQGEAVVTDTFHMICVHHNAGFQLDDGTCAYGPCKGMELRPIEYYDIDDKIYIHKIITEK